MNWLSFHYLDQPRPNFTTIGSSPTETMSYFFKRGRRSYWGGRQVGLSSSYSNFPTFRVDIRIFDRGGCLFKAWGGWGEVLPYKPFRYVLLQRVGFLRRFGLKTGIDFCPFWSGIGMVFKVTAGVYERIYRFSSKWVRKREKYVNLKWILENIFCCCSK